MNHDQIIAAAILDSGRVPERANISARAEEDVFAATRGVDAQARAWNWGEVERLLDRAYTAIGGSNPGTGHDYHCGQHPVQTAMRAFERDE